MTGGSAYLAAGRNRMHTGAPISTPAPVGVSIPVPGSIRNATTLSVP
jgi:hypothetical protein